MKQTDYVVLWRGRDPLLPARNERWDGRFAGMPSFDLDEGEVVKEVVVKRKYTRTGMYVGKCSRTNPDAPQYIPSKKTLEANK